MSDSQKPLTYAESGVDIDVGNRIVDRIRPFARGTRRPGAGAELGGFGGLFDLKAAGFVDPILVAANDGVGTKVKIAMRAAYMTQSALIWWRCVSTTLSFKAPSRCFSWIILLPASWTKARRLQWCEASQKGAHNRDAR